MAGSGGGGGLQKIADASDVASMGSAAHGAIPYIDANGKLAFLAPASDQFVKSKGSGANPILEAVSGAWEKMESKSPAGSESEIDMTGGTWSDKHVVLVAVSNIGPNSNAELWMRVKSGGAWQSGVNDYDWALQKNSSDGAAEGNKSDTGSNRITVVDSQDTTGPEVSILLWIFDPGLSADPTWILQMSAKGDNGQLVSKSGRVSGPTPVQGVRFSYAGTTFKNQGKISTFGLVAA